MRASLAAGGRVQRRIDSAAALSAEAAKTLASDALARRWAGRDRVTLRLAPEFLDLRPGRLIALPPIPGSYRVEEVSIDGLVVIVEARRTHLPGTPLAADPGRPIVAPDVAIGQSVPLLIDLPSLPFGEPGLAVGLALGCSGMFKPTVVEVSANGQPLSRMTVDKAATTGRALTLLGAAEGQLVDRVNAVEVQCDNPAALLFHVDDDALAMGANAAMIGGEVVQFGRADALGAGRYRLSGLLRGRRASEWAVGSHAVGEAFVLLDAKSITAVTIDRAMLGATIEVRALGIADDATDPPSTSVVAAGESLRPLSPCHLRGAIGAGGLSASWLPRRIDALPWVSGSGDPDTSGTRFIVTVSRGAGSIEREVGVAAMSLTPTELASLGSGPVSISVVEVAAGGRSRPVTINLAA